MEITIYKRVLKNGKIAYEVQFPSGKHNTNGKALKTTKRFKTKKEAEEFKAKLIIDNKKGLAVEISKITLNEFIEEWKVDCRANKREGTKALDDCLLTRIKEQLGHYKLRDLKPRQFQDFYNHLKGLGTLGDVYIRKYYKLLQLIMSRAVKMQYIQVNYNSGMYEFDNSQKSEMTIFTDKEFEKLKDNLINEPLKDRTLITITIDIIGRKGEVLGLEWEDVNWEENKLTINKQTQRIKGKIIEVPTAKTDSSNRVLKISQTTISLLKELKEQQDKQKAQLGDNWGGSKKIFTTKDGYNMCPNRPYKILKRLEKKYNLNKKVSFHGLRHTTFSWLLANRPVSEWTIISKRGGHKDLSVTLKIYNHIINHDNIDTVNALEEFFSSSSKNKIDIALQNTTSPKLEINNQNLVTE